MAWSAKCKQLFLMSRMTSNPGLSCRVVTRCIELLNSQIVKCVCFVVAGTAINDALFVLELGTIQGYVCGWTNAQRPIGTTVFWFRQLMTSVVCPEISLLFGDVWNWQYLQNLHVKLEAAQASSAQVRCLGPEHLKSFWIANWLIKWLWLLLWFLKCRDSRKNRGTILKPEVSEVGRITSPATILSFVFSLEKRDQTVKRRNLQLTLVLDSREHDPSALQASLWHFSRARFT